MEKVNTEESSVKSNLLEQIDEIELLQSVYSKPGEFKIEDEAALSQARAFLCGVSPTPPVSLSYTVQTDSEQNGHCLTVDVCCRTHASYPKEPPEVNVRSDHLTRACQDRFNTDLSTFINEDTVCGEVCVYSVVEWVKQEAFGYYMPTVTPPIPVKPVLSSSGNQSIEQRQFSRMWLYMHHIYSKTKRRNILSLSKDFDLTGFCLPGKPGVVCVEGSVFNTNEFYGMLRRWNWKSITCRHREDSSSGGSAIDEQRRFDGFRELSFDVHGPRGNHLDLGQFRRYLTEHRLEYMFKELFGVEGK